MTDPIPGRRGTDITIPFTLPTGTTGADFVELWFTLRREEPASNVPDDTDLDVLFKALKTVGTAFTIAADAAAGTVTIPAATSRTWLVNRPGYFFDVKGKRASGAIVWITDGRLAVLPDITRSAS